MFGSAMDPTVSRWLNKLGVESNDVVMIVTPNHIFVPIAYLGTVGSGRIFSGANPAYTRW